MKLGQFVCLGSLQRLKNRFGHGYAVQVKVPINTTNRFKDELIFNLPGIEIEGKNLLFFTTILSILNKLEQHNGMLYCNVPISSLTDRQQSETRQYNLADVFKFFNDKREQNKIESYSITQTTLEQIFVRLAGQDQETTPTAISF
jgi:hypothetical protein